MRAAEVLNRYAKGERNFQGSNLKGQNFRNQDLSGADFSRADIRGTDFSKAILKNSNFSQVRCGLHPIWKILLPIISVSVSSISGFTASVFNLQNQNLYGTWLWVFSILVITMIVLALSLSPKDYSWKITLLQLLILQIGAAFFVWLGLGSMVAILLGSYIASLPLFALNIELGGRKSSAIAFISITVSFLSAIYLVKMEILASGQWVIYASANLCIAAILNYFMAKNYDLNLAVSKFSSFIFSHSGTKFNYVNLMDSDFSLARLCHTSFFKANKDRAYFYDAKQVIHVWPSDGYLSSKKTQDLVVSADGKGQNFDRLDLRGINLRNASLKGCSFRMTNLSGANLQGADLTDTILVQTQLDDADLRGATLTGATIEDWGITSKTKLDNIQCAYVYMRDTPPDTPEKKRRRKPDDLNQEFEDGDFADFIRPLADTLDLYHNRDVDPRAIAIAFKQLSDSNPEAKLQIVAMETRGDDNFLLRAKTDEQADKSELSAQYTQNYHQVRSLPSDQQYQLWMSEKEHSQRLLKVIETFAARPMNIELKQGDYMPSQRDINISQDDRSIKVGGDMIGNVVGDQTTADIKIQQADLPAPQSVDIHQELAVLKQLLSQIQSDDHRKITNAISDAEDELKKPQPDKDEIGQALGRALDYAKKAEGFAESIAKLRPHVVNAASWLGKNWYKLLAIVGLAA